LSPIQEGQKVSSRHTTDGELIRDDIAVTGVVERLLELMVRQATIAHKCPLERIENAATGDIWLIAQERSQELSNVVDYVAIAHIVS